MRDFVRRPAAQKHSGQIIDILREALDLFHDTFEEHHIAVRQVEVTPLPPLSFDPRQVHQVFLNLLKNALEAMPQGGEVTITSRVQDTKAEISIADTGEGMTPEVAENIFQPYFTTKEKGTGLGLAICQSIIQEHGGTLSVVSSPGGGTTFIIQLPIDDAPQAQE
jgi:signal transduction histidine kinase